MINQDIKDKLKDHRPLNVHELYWCFKQLIEKKWTKAQYDEVLRIDRDNRRMKRVANDSFYHKVQRIFTKE